MRRWVPLASLVAGLVVAAGLVTALFGRPAAGLLLASPVDRAVLARPPAEVRLTFAGDLDPVASHLSVVDDRGASVATGPPTVVGASVDLPLAITRAGYYRVAYHVTLANRGELSGFLGFRVAGGGPAEPPAVASAPSTHEHNGTLDPLTATVLGANGVALAIIGTKLIRRRRRPVGTSAAPRRTIPS